MMLRHAIQHIRMNVRRGVQNVETELHMLFHQFKFGWCEALVFLQQLDRDFDFAKIEQHAEQAQVRQARFWIAQMTPECDHIHGHTQTVSVGRHILLAQTRHPHHRVGVTHHALDHVINHGLHILQMERIAAANILSHAMQQIIGAGEGFMGELNFFFDR